MRKLSTLILAAGLFLQIPGPCNAQNRSVYASDLTDGLIAYTIGEYSVAFRILNSLADKDEPLAQMFLGRMYEHGFGLPQNCNQARHWLTRGASGGSADAATELASLYKFGRCAPQSESEALRWYLQAAQNGDSQAPNAIGEIYLGGGDVLPDFEKAAFWFFRGVKLYDAAAYCHLGYMHKNGWGASKDPIEAYKWFALCARISIPNQIGEVPPGIKERDQVRENLTLAQVAEGERRANEFREK